jgi:predicted membrane channel-forming protein YqfA (hemolysin III family)
MNWRVWAVLCVLLAAAAVTLFITPIPQSQAYHDFADHRTILRIPNFCDVMSNVFFLLVGTMGIAFVLREATNTERVFADPRERWPYLVFFASVALTAFGSAYYHLQPDDYRLVWDRIPITSSVVSVLAAIVAERVSVKAGLRLLTPLLLLGAGSVIYWSMTQTRGHGDLRPYGLVQFGSMLALLLLLALFPPRYTRGADFLISLGLYALAKIFETADRLIFSIGGIVSGHTLKHIFAAASAYWILRMLKLRAPVTSPGA